MMDANAQLFLRHIAQTSDAPLMLEIVRANQCFLYDPDGREYLDLISGISVSNVGHGHPEVIKAVKDQVDQYMHVMVYGEFVEAPQVKYAQWLSAHLPDPLDAVFFVNSGSEAIEGALKLAKRATGRTEIVSFHQAYHGATHGAMSLGSTEERKSAYRPLLTDNRILPYNDVSVLDQITSRTAAVVIEPVQGEAGVRNADEGYVKALRDRCHATGALLVFDECQTGFGRTGNLFFSGKYQVVPDVVTLGKALGGGMPLGAFVASTELMQCLSHNPVLGHITTFGGHPVSCAAGLAAARLLTEDLLKSVEEKAQRFIRDLQHPLVVEVRHAGLLMAVEWPSAEFNKSLISKLIQRGLVTDWFLFNDQSMRIAPATYYNQ
jgi:acetylornithine/N-succinyldiaminopimelate aminotransferase